MKYEDKYHPSDQLLFRSLEEGEYELTSNRLVSLRARHFPREHRAQMHYHNTIEINVNHNVNGTLWINGSTEKLEDIKVLITPPGVMHSFDFKGGDGTFDVLHISLTRLGEFLNMKNIFGDQFNQLHNIPNLSDSYNQIENIVDEMKEISEDDLFSQLQLVLKIFSIILKKSQYFKKENKNSEFLKKVIDFTEKNFKNKITLDEVSSNVGLSRSYFSRYFKQNTGTGYFSYLKLMRLESAKEKLRSGKSVTESCYSCGFDNISYFIQLFKNNNNGISPGKYRE
ncbi:MAG: AraC family transcriptional regulator [Spirochaetaceae bacterium]|jgi:AraC-like DNA-binding protein|nr:AraC family transcriptional regulator [Spirochaetaceae bacterium]